MHSPLLLSITILIFSCAASPPPSIDSANAQQLYCFQHKDWTKPHWPATAIENIFRISRRLRERYWRPNQGQEFEFLPHGEVPLTGLPLVRTPFKLTLGTQSTVFLFPAPGSLSSSRKSGAQLQRPTYLE